MGMVDLDPSKRRREVHPVGAGVEPRSDVDDRVDPPGRDGRAHEPIDHDGSDGHDPCPVRQGACDVEAPSTGQAGSERVIEQCIRAAGFHGPPAGGQQCGVGYALDPVVRAQTVARFASGSSSSLSVAPTAPSTALAALIAVTATSLVMPAAICTMPPSIRKPPRTVLKIASLS